MTCSQCNDTGSLSKNLWGDLDCPHCDIADERVAVEKWVRQHTCADTVDAWLIYQRGKAAAMQPA